MKPKTETLPKSEFRPGDVVCLKSGGHDMTIDKVLKRGIDCIWSDGKRLRTRKIPPHVLMLSGKNKGIVQLVINKTGPENSKA